METMEETKLQMEKVEETKTEEMIFPNCIWRKWRKRKWKKTQTKKWKWKKHKREEVTCLIRCVIVQWWSRPIQRLMFIWERKKTRSLKWETYAARAQETRPLTTNFVVYPEPLSEKLNILLNHNKMYINDEKVNQYVSQNTFELRAGLF